MTKLIGCMVAVMAACGGSKSPAPTTATPTPATTAAPTAPAAPGCPSITFSCALKDGDEQVCIEGGDDFAKVVKDKCTPAEGGQPSTGPCVRTGAAGGCITQTGAVPGLDACTVTWVVKTSTVNNATEMKTQCEAAKGVFVAN